MAIYRQIKIMVFIILTLLTVIILVVGCSKGTTGKKSLESETSTVAPRQTRNWRLAKSPDDKLQLKVPRDWEVKKTDDLNLGKGKLLIVFGPTDNNYRTNLQVSIEKLPDMTLPEYIAQFEKNTREDTGTKELKILKTEKFDSIYGNAFRKKYSYLLDAQGQRFNLVFDVLYLRKADNYYIIQFVTTNKLYGNVKNTFGDILATIKIR